MQSLSNLIQEQEKFVKAREYLGGYDANAEAILHQARMMLEILKALYLPPDGLHGDTTDGPHGGDRA